MICRVGLTPPILSIGKSDMTNRGSKLLAGAALIAVLAGLGTILFTATVIRFMAHDDVYLLETRDNPNGDPSYEPHRTYDTLYQRTERLVHHRNHFALRFHYTLGAAFIVIGGVLAVWSCDRARLLRKQSEVTGED